MLRFHLRNQHTREEIRDRRWIPLATISWHTKSVCLSRFTSRCSCNLTLQREARSAAEHAGTVVNSAFVYTLVLMSNTTQIMGSLVLHPGVVGFTFVQDLTWKTNHLPLEKVLSFSSKGADCAENGSGGFHTVCREENFWIVKPNSLQAQWTTSCDFFPKQVNPILNFPCFFSSLHHCGKALIARNHPLPSFHWR